MVADPKTINEEENKISDIVIIGGEELEGEDKTGEEEKKDPKDTVDTSDED